MSKFILTQIQTFEKTHVAMNFIVLLYRLAIARYACKTVYFKLFNDAKRMGWDDNETICLGKD